MTFAKFISVQDVGKEKFKCEVLQTFVTQNAYHVQNQFPALFGGRHMCVIQSTKRLF